MKYLVALPKNRFHVMFAGKYFCNNEQQTFVSQSITEGSDSFVTFDILVSRTRKNVSLMENTIEFLLVLLFIYMPRDSVSLFALTFLSTHRKTFLRRNRGILFGAKF